MGFRLAANFLLLALSLSSFSLAAPTSQDPCSALAKYADSEALTVPASEAYACLLSPPFDKTRSANVYQQVRKLAHILSSQAFFNDPKGLPLIVNRVDLNGTFDSIKDKIDKNKYENDYQFNRDLTELFGGFHDGHTIYYTNCQNMFGSFRHNHSLVSIVPPGEDTPRIYLADPPTGEVGEEIVEIAGEKALDHLLKLVKVLKGPYDAAWIDADTRWNGLFVGRDALDILPGNFAHRDMYPGPDFNMKTVSGKVIDVKWFVDGPGSLAWESPDAWKKMFQSTDSAIALKCKPRPSTTNSNPPPTTTTPKIEDTTDDTTDETTEDTDETDDADEDVDEDDADGPDESDEEDTGKTKPVTTKSKGSQKHGVKKTSTGNDRYGTSLDFDFLDFITRRTKKRSVGETRKDFDVDWRKVLKARGDGDTIEDFSDLQLVDRPPKAYPQVESRMNGTEQTLTYLKAYPDVAVWGIHSFYSRDSDPPPDNVHFFYYWRSYMIDTLKKLKEKGIKRLILDMSNNGGGSVVLGMETVRRFFPEAEPFYGVDYRRSPWVDFLLTRWNVTHGLNRIDGKPFKSIDDFLNPPVPKRGDHFTQIGRFNQLGDSEAEIPKVKFTTKGDPPFSVENIVILTDGQCGSTCAITVEALVGIGIATVVTGGQPTAKGNKTMQYVGGVKGYQVLEFNEVAVAEDADDNPEAVKPYVPRPIDISYDPASIRCNFRNSYTPDDHIIPQEFIFQPADAHLWYTKQMIVDRTILWDDVVKLTWDDNGVNKLLKARGGNKKEYKGTNHRTAPHPQQGKAGYRGQRTRGTLKDGVLADLKYLATGWLGAWSYKD